MQKVSELGCFQKNKLITTPQTGLLTPHALASWPRLVLQKDSVSGGREPAQIYHCSFCWVGRPHVRKEKKILLKGIYFTFLQEVSFQLNPNCRTFTLHYGLLKFKYIQPTNLKTDQNKLFFMPDKAIRKIAKIDYGLQSVLVVVRIWSQLWSAGWYACKILWCNKAWQFCSLLNSGHFWSEQERWTTQVAARVDW